MGHAVTVFEARNVPGGLNTLGIAAYKISTEFALSEIEMIRRIGIDIELNHRVTAAELPALLDEYRRRFPGHRPGPDACRSRSRAKTWKASGNRSTSSSRPTRGRSTSARSGATSS